MSRRRVWLSIKKKMKAHDISVDVVWELCSEQDRVQIFNEGMANLNKETLLRIENNVDTKIIDQSSSVVKITKYHEFWNVKDVVHLLYQYIPIKQVWKLSVLNVAITKLVQDAKYCDNVDDNHIKKFIIQFF